MLACTQHVKQKPAGLNGSSEQPSALKQFFCAWVLSYEQVSLFCFVFLYPHAIFSNEFSFQSNKPFEKISFFHVSFLFYLFILLPKQTDPIDHNCTI